MTHPVARRSRSFISLIVAVLLHGCVTTGSGLVVTPSPLVTSRPDPSLDALLAAAYAPADVAPHALLRAQLAATAERFPDAFEVHEVAGVLALLDGDLDAALDAAIRAAADRRADAASTLLAVDRILALTERQGDASRAIGVLAALAREHDHALVRQAAAVDLAQLVEHFGTDDAARAARLPFTLGAPLIAAPFDNDQGKGFLIPYAPELEVALDEEMAGLRVPVRFRPVTVLTTSGRVPVTTHVSPTEHVVVYLLTHVEAPVDLDAFLVVDSDSPLRAWVNGAPVLEVEQLKGGGSPAALTAPVRLAKGTNEILFKLAHETGSAALGAILVDASGRELALPAPATRPRMVGPRREGPVPPLAFPLGLDGLPDGPRRAFLESRLLRRAGLAKEALAHVRALAQRVPGNLVITRELANLALQNDEEGTSIDTVSALASATGLPAFLVERARFFERKGQLDRAQDALLELLDDDPTHVEARIALARVLGGRGWAVDRARVLDGLFADRPDDPRVLVWRAEAARARGFLDDELAALEAAQRLVPGRAAVAMTLADRLADRGQLDDAQAVLTPLTERLPHMLAIPMRLADYARRVGRRDDARALLTRAAVVDPWDPGIARALAEMAYEDGDRERALELWRRALLVTPSDARLTERVSHVAAEGLAHLVRRAPSDDEIARVIAEAPRRALPPGTHTDVLFDHEVTEVHADGSSTGLVTLVRRAATRQGRDALIQDQIEGGRTQIKKAYSVARDGTRQEASSIRGGTVRFRALDEGSTTVIQYVAHRAPQPFLPTHYTTSWYFQRPFEARRLAEWTLLLPKARPLHVAITGPVTSTVVDEGDTRVRTFRIVDGAPFIPEPATLPVGELLAHVSVSTVGSWDEYVKWERALLRGAFRPSPELHALALRLVGDATTARERFFRLFHFVAQEIRYQQDYENTIAGVRPHACPIVLERGYGDCKDKAVLLIALGREVGLDVDFAILRTRPAGVVERDIPNQQFNHAIVYVPAQGDIGEGFFMDPTTDGLDIGALRSDDQGAWSLVLSPDDGAWRFEPIPYQSADTSRIVITGAVDVATAEPRASLQFEVRGEPGAFARRAFRDAETAKKVLVGLSSLIFPASTLEDSSYDARDDVWTPVTARADVGIRPSVHVDGKKTRIDLPFPTVIGASAWSLPTRTHDLYVGPPSQIESELVLSIPAGARVETLPPPVAIDDPCLRARRTVVVEGATVTIQTFAATRCPLVERARYAEFRGVLESLAARTKDPLILTR